MQINVSDILTKENTTQNFTAELEMNTFRSKLGEFTIVQKQPIILILSNVSATKFSIECVVDLSINIPCDRCLKDVKTDFHFDISKDIDMEDEEKAYCMFGYNLDVDKLVYSEILVNWPMKILCRDDCKGICNSCGANLNLGTCDCQSTKLDPRMAVIQDIFKDFKEV